mgnify:FL=1
MGNKQLTPFEKAEQNRTQGMKRLVGVLAIHAWLAQIKKYKQAGQKMSIDERVEWDRIIILAMQRHREHFGYEA